MSAPLTFERAPRGFFRLPKGIVAFVFALTPLLLFVVLGVSGGVDWLERTLVKEGGVPESALVGTIVALVLVPLFLGLSYPIWHLLRFGACELRPGLLSFSPSGFSVPRDEVTGWERRKHGVAVFTAYRPRQPLTPPLLIPADDEKGFTRALRWLEESEPPPPAEGEERPPPALIVGQEKIDLWFPLALLFLCFALMPTLAYLRGLTTLASIGFAVGGFMSVIASLVYARVVTRHLRRARVVESTLVIAGEGFPLADVEEIALEGEALAFTRRLPSGKAKREWVVVPSEQLEGLRAALEAALEPLGKRLSDYPSWAGRKPRRDLGALACGLVIAAGIAPCLLPDAVWGRLGARFGIYQELHLRDDDGHILTLLYEPGAERARFLYLAGEGVMGGIAGYQVRVPGLLGDPGYGLSLGSGGRDVDLAAGRIQDGAYQRSIDRGASLALRVNEGEWETSSDPLPRELLPLVQSLKASKRVFGKTNELSSLPRALEPLLADPECPKVLRDFVLGRTSWRSHEVSDAGGERLVAVVLQGRVRVLALLPKDEPYAIQFAILGGKTILYRALEEGPDPPPPGVLAITKKEDYSLCWPVQGQWQKSPLGTVELDPCLAALAKVRARELGAREALKGLLGAKWPQALED